MGSLKHGTARFHQYLKQVPLPHVISFLIVSHVLCSKPLMDLLVTLCAKYHLNPSSHTLELVTTNKKNTKLKPNALIGSLEAEKIILKPKGEDKNKKTGPQMPEVCLTRDVIAVTSTPVSQISQTLLLLFKFSVVFFPRQLSGW